VVIAHAFWLVGILGGPLALAVGGQNVPFEAHGSLAFALLQKQRGL
jgi:hypothetical protein